MAKKNKAEEAALAQVKAMSKESNSRKDAKDAQVAKAKRAKKARKEAEVSETGDKKYKGKKDGFDPNKLTNRKYEAEMERLERELVKLQEWVRAKKLKVVVVFEGRDAAGKGGVIKRIAGCLNPRVCRVAALPTPTSQEKTQWYFQRYVKHLPAGGEIVLFDRSWYNRAGVERVMGFCTQEELEEFYRAAPEFERMLVRSGTILVKYWFSVSDDIQEERFQDRMQNPVKRWKLSPMDLQSRAKWIDYSIAKDEMFAKTDTSESRWWVVPADKKKAARLNCIAHFLSCIPYKDLTPKPIKLPPRQKNKNYKRPPETDQHFVPEKY